MIIANKFVYLGIRLRDVVLRTGERKLYSITCWFEQLMNVCYTCAREEIVTWSGIPPVVVPFLQAVGKTFGKLLA